MIYFLLRIVFLGLKKCLLLDWSEVRILDASMTNPKIGIPLDTSWPQDYAGVDISPVFRTPDLENPENR